MQSLAAFVRQRDSGGALSPAELDKRAREVVDAIDAETGSRTAHAARVQRLYALGQDIQNARIGGARDVTVHKIVQYLMYIIARNYGLGFAR